jgi:hypothetical protein
VICSAIVNWRVLRRTIYACKCDYVAFAINRKRVKQLTLRRHWVTLATSQRGEDTQIGAAVWTE